MRNKEDVLVEITALRLSGNGGYTKSVHEIIFLYNTNYISIVHEIADYLTNKECNLLEEHANQVLHMIDMSAVNAIIQSRYLKTLETLLCSSVLSTLDRTHNYKEDIRNEFSKP